MFSEPDEYSERYECMSSLRIDYLSEHGQLEPNRQDAEDSTIALMSKYLSAGNKVLDVGIGLARQLSRFPQCERYGMDISFGYLERANELGINVCFARVEEMPYSKDFFDAVVCTDILEHFIDLNVCVEKI